MSSKYAKKFGDNSGVITPSNSEKHDGEFYHPSSAPVKAESGVHLRKGISSFLEALFNFPNSPFEYGYRKQIIVVAHLWGSV